MFNLIHSLFSVVYREQRRLLGRDAESVVLGRAVRRIGQGAAWRTGEEAPDRIRLGRSTRGGDRTSQSLHGHTMVCDVYQKCLISMEEFAHSGRKITV